VETHSYNAALSAGQQMAAATGLLRPREGVTSDSLTTGCNYKQSRDDSYDLMQWSDHNSY